MLKMMVLAFILSIGIITVQSFATSDNVSPLQQWNNGTPITGIQCSNDLILLQSPSGKPACVTQETSIKLEQRGYAIIKSADMVTESSTTEQGLMRGPAPTTIRGSTIDGASEMNLSYEQLLEQKEASASGANGQSNEFNPADWVPSYIPENYKIEQILHGLNYGNHGLRIYFVPDDFIATSETTESDIIEGNGITYYVFTFSDPENFDEVSDFPYSSSLGLTIVDQTNDYYGVMNLNNDLPGFWINAVFDDYQVSIRNSGPLTKTDGINMVNSIQGVIFPIEE